MRFKDLKLIQQVAILSNMIDKPDVSKRLEKNIYHIPDTDYIVDAVEAYTATDIYVPMSPDTLYPTTGVNFSVPMYDGNYEDKLQLEFVLGHGDDVDSPIDKFGLLAGMEVKGELATGLQKVIDITKTLFKLGFVKNNPSEILKRLLSLIPIAESLPTELFERIYIDPIGAKMVSDIHESINVVLRQEVLESKANGVLVCPYYFGHILDSVREDTDDGESRLTVTFGYGVLGLGNVITVRVNDFKDDVFKPEYLASIKATSTVSVESVLESLKRDVYYSINKHVRKEELIPLVDEYFKLLEQARPDIIGRSMPF